MLQHSRQCLGRIRRELQRIVVLGLDRRRRHAHDVLLLGAQMQILADAEHDLAHDLPQAVQHLLGFLFVEALCRQSGHADFEETFVSLAFGRETAP